MADNEIRELKVKRGALKRSLTTTETALEKNDTSNLASLDPVGRLQKIEENWKDFQAIQSRLEILSCDDDDELNLNYAERDKFESRHFAITGSLKGIISELPVERTRENSPTSSLSNLSNSRGVELNSNIKLPTINLPTFSGSYDTWIGFSDIFKSIVHENERIPAIQKLHYLKSCLKDEAASVISALETSSKNYQVAWDLLEERFNNHRFIVESHTKALLELPSVSKEFPIRALLDHIQKHFRALEALKVPVDKWDTILISLIKGRLNQFNRDKWEDSTIESKLPTMKEMITFLQRRAQLEETRLEDSQSKNQGKIESNKSNSKFSRKPNTQHAHVSTQSKPICFLCKGEHPIYSCEQFLKLSILERSERVKTLALCPTCLLQNSQSHKCRLGPCKKCKGKHNSLLHSDQPESQISALTTDNETSVYMQTTNAFHSLISTALVEIQDAQGTFHPCRVLLDSGSQSHYLTAKKAQFLNLKTEPVNVHVTGLSLSQTTITKSVTTVLKSRINNYEKGLDFFVVPHITSKLPSVQINRSNLKIPQNITLADPEFHKPAEIDALLGVQLFYKLLSVGQIKIPHHDAILQKTKLGWILAGNVYQESRQSKSEVCHLTFNSMSNDLSEISQFWELDQVPNKKFLSSEAQACEAHFLENTRRDCTGRYIVKLPFNELKVKLGQSFNMAKRRFFHLENKFQKDVSLKDNYSDFLKEYESLGHMSEAPESTMDTGYFIPHHAIMKDDKKFRVVFDGSADDSNGLSLNDTLMVGPTIQDDLFSIYVRFRSFPYALTMDIEKMYRQILVDEQDSNFQKILWRENPYETIKIYNLNTVTYGTASAPYLATRVLSQLASDEENSFPFASQILKRDFYVDDGLTGADTFEQALTLRDELIDLLKRGGFTLRKWASNDPRLVSNLEHKANDSLILLQSVETVKTLGISWRPSLDHIIYSINNPPNNSQITKRIILSDLAKLFDPLGLLSPIIVYAKLIVQHLWKLKLAWDDPLTHDIQQRWLEFKNQLSCINQLHFDRCILLPESKEIEIHGFCDASEKAYAACIYLRSIDKAGKCKTQLVCSKSRLAPIHPVTLPRLELCSALLLARLLTVTKQALEHLKIEKQFLWSDSTIALCWIKTPPCNLKTFVANRVGEILEVTKPQEWKHVRSEDNPADLPSRGCLPKDFMTDTLWQQGPQWLMQEKDTWPQLELKPINVPETKKGDNSKAFTLTNSDTQFLTRFSSFPTLIRVIGYCLRFAYNAKTKASDRLTGQLSNDEYKRAHDSIIKIAQLSEFSKEIHQLSNKTLIHNKSKLLNLSPFLDSGILKVGGRLTNSNLNVNQKHPIVLPRNHHVTKLIIREHHKKLKHAGIHSTLYSVREFYWPLDGKNITRKLIRQCVTCFRANPRSFDYTMGNLPADRTNSARPFSIIGVDYCGPFFVKEKRYRNTKKIKSYVAVFVCFVTRAVHLELVSDLTSEAFIGCLKKVFARRGKAIKIYSDNGTNFVGANRYLKEVEELLNSTTHKQKMAQFLESERIVWKFSPPRAPHFGGLWEAAVKSFKHHFTRTVGDAVLTFEQLQVYVCEIEAILNSRPLSPLSSDPNDLRPLTPGHFLIGGPLTALPEEDFSDVKPSRLSLWQHAQQMRQHFWCRWQKEYLNELITRSKWKFGSSDIPIGTMVVLKEDNLPPMQWSLGRITALHPGPDGIVRVVTVKTRSTSYKRSVRSLYPLPIDQ